MSCPPNDSSDLLSRLYYACRKQEVSFHLAYNEHDDTWYVSIDSPAPSERFITKDLHSMRDVIEAGVKWAETLSAKRTD